MTQAQILADNVGSKRVLANLSLAIDEARLVRRIMDIEDNLRRIENLPEESARISFLRDETDRLEQKLAETRRRAQENSA